MSAERLNLDAIQSRADAASEGPWAWEATGEKDNSWAVGQVLDEDDGEFMEGELDYGEGEVIEGICEGIDGHIPDAEFIAHARMDVPALVAELRAARDVIEALRDQDEHLGLGTFNALAAYDKVTGESQ